MNQNEPYKNDSTENLKNLPFEVPEGYFENFSHDIQSKIQSEDLSTGSKIIRLLKPISVLAAAMLLIAILGYQGLRILKVDSSDEILTKDISEIIELEWYELNDEIIIQEAIHTEQAINSDELIEYLNHEDVDIQEIIEIL